MNRFVKRFLLFLLPILVIAFSIEILIRQIPNEYSYKRAFLDAKANNIEILFLGTSHAYYGVNPDFVKGNSFNAANVSQTIDYDYEIFKKYEDQWKALQWLIIPIDYSTLFSRLADSKSSWRIKNYKIYYDIHKECRFSKSTEIFSLKLSKNIERLIAYYLYNSSFINCSKLGFGINKGPSRNLDLTGISAAKRHTKSNKKHIVESLIILDNLVKIAKKKSINVLFYTSPAYHTYVSNLDIFQLELTVNSVKDIINDSPNCYYYNFLVDDSFKNIDFKDADHLNESGAKKLSIRLDSIINKLK